MIYGVVLIGVVLVLIRWYWGRSLGRKDWLGCNRQILYMYSVRMYVDSIVIAKLAVMHSRRFDICIKRTTVNGDAR